MESRRLVIALVVALGVCLLVIGIFIGRESARPDTSPPAPVAAAPQKPLPPIFEPPAQPIAAPPPPSAPSSPAIDPEEKRRVAQYFRDVDKLQNVDVDDPQASAQAIINSAGSGDDSGLQKMIAQARRAEQQARALVPPAPCAAYHKKLVALLSESREMIQKLAAGFAGGSLDALPTLMSRAQAEQTRQESLAHEEKELKRRYGL